MSRSTAISRAVDSGAWTAAISGSWLVRERPFGTSAPRVVLDHRKI